MNTAGLMQLALYFGVLTVLVQPVGAYIARVYTGRNRWSLSLLGWLEQGIYRLCRIDTEADMSWIRYARAYLVFHVIGVIAVYAILRVQNLLPYNPAGLDAVNWHVALNTAVSFVTNTNWQAYGGESTMSHFSQMVALTVQNFLSPAAGLVPLIALVRGITRRQAQAVGNFYVDMVRSLLYVLLPMALILAVALIWQGVPQTFSGQVTVGGPAITAALADAHGPSAAPAPSAAASAPSLEIAQTIALGPVASQVAIKQLGTNGGGYYNVNSAHPLENPTPLSNFLEMLAILLIPAALCITYGRLAGDERQGWALYAAMLILLVPLTLASMQVEQTGNPLFTALGVDQQASVVAPGGNMEGKELRFGVANSAIWAAATTAASNGSVNAMHDSFMPLSGLVPLFLMQLGEVVFGGVGSGLYGMLMYVVIGVFVAGLLVGRTPEYLGKKMEAFEVKMASLVILVPPILVLTGTAVAVLVDAGRAGTANPLAHGFSEILYAFTSAGNNNGSAFAGLTVNTPFYDVALAIAMFLSRFWLAIPVLAIAGSLARKKSVAVTAGTLATHTPLFVALLIGTVLLVGALTFVPALVLGPVVDHLQLGGTHP